MNEIIINKIEWTAPEYNHKERTPDWFWTIGLVFLVGSGIAFYFHNYLFAIFIFISGACLILFTLRHPRESNFSIETTGITLGKEMHEWKTIKGFNIKKGEPYSKLLIETSKHFLPIYTIPIPESLLPKIKESLLKIVPVSEINESRSLLFMEKLGF